MVDLTTVTIQDFKNRFYRDFTFNNQNSNPFLPPSNPDIVQDVDITEAYNNALAVINVALFGPPDGAIVSAYLLLSAHFLCLNIKGAQAGLNGGGGNFPISSGSVGSVSESYSIPEAYTNSPILTPYTQTSYGLRYLALALPRMVGNITAVMGGVAPNSDVDTPGGGVWWGA